MCAPNWPTVPYSRPRLNVISNSAESIENFHFRKKEKEKKINELLNKRQTISHCYILDVIGLVFLFYFSVTITYTHTS